jgi:hypothetical protein
MAPAGYIDEPTRKHLEEVGQRYREALHERDLAIMEAVEKGISLRTVGEAVGLTHAGVRNAAMRKRDELDGREPRKGNYPVDPTDPREW